MKPGAGQGSPLRVAPPVQSDTGQLLHPSRARHLHHDGRVMETAFLLGRGRGAGDLGGQGQGGLWLRQERAGGRSGGWVAAVVVGRGGAGCVLLRFVLFFDVVVDVLVVQIVDVGVQLLDKVVLPVAVQDWGYGPDSAARGVRHLQFLDKVVTCPSLRMSCSSC